MLREHWVTSSIKTDRYHPKTKGPKTPPTSSSFLSKTSSLLYSLTRLPILQNLSRIAIMTAPTIKLNNGKEVSKPHIRDEIHEVPP